MSAWKGWLVVTLRRSVKLGLASSGQVKHSSPQVPVTQPLGKKLVIFPHWQYYFLHGFILRLKFVCGVSASKSAVSNVFGRLLEQNGGVYKSKSPISITQPTNGLLSVLLLDTADHKVAVERRWCFYPLLERWSVNSWDTSIATLN